MLSPTPPSEMLTTVVVTYNNKADIDWIIKQAQAIDSCSRVVVVDNGSDGAGDAAALAGAVVLRRPDNPGFGTSQNAGAAEANTPFLLLLNPDAHLVPGAVDGAIHLLTSDPRIAAAQGIIMSTRTQAPERSMGPDLTWKHLAGRALALRRLLGTRFGKSLARQLGVGDAVDRVPESLAKVDTLAATALLIRTASFNEVGGFDEGFFLYGEDLDLCRRLRLSGWQLVGIPVPWASHADGSTSTSFFQRELEWWSGVMRYAMLWWTPLEFFAALLSAILMAARLTACKPCSLRLVLHRMVVTPVRQRRGRTSAS